MIQKPNYSQRRKAHLVLFLLLPIVAIGQEVFTDNTDDMTPAAPINNYLVLVIFTAIYLAFYFLKTCTKNLTKKDIN